MSKYDSDFFDGIEPIDSGNGIVGLPIKKPDPVPPSSGANDFGFSDFSRSSSVDGGLAPYLVPDDTYYATQWHISDMGNIPAIWDNFTGDGVTFLVLDDGFEYDHPDLAGNYVSNHFGAYDPYPDDRTRDVSDPSYPIYGDAHGTAVGGIIAAVGGNTLGVTGVSPEATITGMDFLGEIQTVGFEEMVLAFSHGVNFDITNNSWGSTPAGVWEQSLSNPNSFDKAIADSAQSQAENGRGNKGTVILKAAGNEDLIAAGEGKNNAPQIITIAAMDEGGTIASYSNWGSSILVAGPAASNTTDLIGDDGYATATEQYIQIGDGDYTNTFNGTSAATPAVAGVVGLMLDANPNLGWRDVQNILAESASQTGSSFGASGSGSEHGSWMSNSAANWNGGGYTYHSSYGYGAVDAFAAVRMAEAWWLFDLPKTSANYTTKNVDSDISTPIQMDEGGTTSFTIDVPTTANVQIEDLLIELDLDYDFPGDLVMTLKDPDGASHVFWDGQSLSYPAWNQDEATTFKVTGQRGTLSPGTWEIEIVDTYDDDSLVGEIHSASLTFHGHAFNSKTIHTVTPDYLDLAAVEGSRSEFRDTDGSTQDWLNAVSLTEKVEVALATNDFISGSINTGIYNIENVASGDGHDSLRGTASKNKFFAGRGDDFISGWAGRDVMWGAKGDDLLFGGKGRDKQYGGQGADKITGGPGPDRMYLGKDSDIDTVFINSPIHSKPGSAKRDKIYQFDSGVDKLDLSGMDANANAPGNDAFTFGSSPANYALWTEARGSALDDTILYGDYNGDAVADFEVRLFDTGLLAGDIIL